MAATHRPTLTADRLGQVHDMSMEVAFFLDPLYDAITNLMEVTPEDASIIEVPSNMANLLRDSLRVTIDLHNALLSATEELA